MVQRTRPEALTLTSFRINRITNSETTIYNPYNRNTDISQNTGRRGSVIRALLNSTSFNQNSLSRLRNTVVNLPTIHEHASLSCPPLSLLERVNALGVTGTRQAIFTLERVNALGITGTRQAISPAVFQPINNVANPPADTQVTEDEEETNLSKDLLCGFDNPLYCGNDDAANLPIDPLITKVKNFDNPLFGITQVTEIAGLSNKIIQSSLKENLFIEDNDSLSQLRPFSKYHFHALMIDSAMGAMNDPNDPLAKSILTNKYRNTENSKLRLKLIKDIATSNKITKENARILLEKSIGLHLNKDIWPKIKTEIKSPTGQCYFNELTPSSQMKAGADKTPLFNYHNNFNGIATRSNTLANSHAVNLWSTQLLDQNKQTIFEGIRHGVLASSDIEYSKERESMQEEKVRELFTSAVFLKYKNEIENYIEQKKIDPETPIPKFDLKMTSTSLMTLKNMKIGSIINEREKTLNFDQIEALNKGTQNIEQIEISGCSFPVNIEVCSFSCPVNELSIGRFSLVNRTGWELTNDINKVGFRTLFGDKENNVNGWVSDKITELKNKEGKTPDEIWKNEILIKQITTLSNEIQDISQNKTDMKKDDDLFKSSRRIVALTHLIGAVPAFNCKSGKDRTAVLDNEVKALLANFHQQKEANNVAEPTTKVEDLYLQPFYTDPANYRIQQLNTGLIGNKCSNYQNPYFRSILTKEQFALFKGECNDA